MASYYAAKCKLFGGRGRKKVCDLNATNWKVWLARFAKFYRFVSISLKSLFVIDWNEIVAGFKKNGWEIELNLQIHFSWKDFANFFRIKSLPRQKSATEYIASSVQLLHCLWRSSRTFLVKCNFCFFANNFAISLHTNEIINALSQTLWKIQIVEKGYQGILGKYIFLDFHQFSNFKYFLIELNAVIKNFEFWKPQQNVRLLVS